MRDAPWKGVRFSGLFANGVTLRSKKGATKECTHIFYAKGRLVRVSATWRVRGRLTRGAFVGV